MFLFSPISTLSVTEPIPIGHISHVSKQEEEQDAPVSLSLEKLFVPPETQVSVDDPSLSTRILKGSNIVLSKYSRDAQVVQAEFVKSSVKTEDCASDGLPDFALVDRSNVGKSSLLNSLVRRKKLALTSKKPAVEEAGDVHKIFVFRLVLCYHLTCKNSLLQDQRYGTELI